MGEEGIILTSVDGLDWVIATTPAYSFDMESIAWNGQGGADALYVATGYGMAFTSSDTAVVWDGSQFVTTTDYGVLTWDGVTMHSGTLDPWWKWSLFDSSYPYPNLRDIIWTGSQFVAVGYNGRVYTSPDATETSTWTEQASGTTSNLEAVTEGAGRFVAVGAAGTILISDDGGVTWATQTSDVNAFIYDVTWTGSRFVAVGYSGLILTSIDGIDWAAANHGNDHLYSVFSDGTDTVIAGAKGTIIRNN